MENTFTKQSISIDLSNKMIAKAFDKARETGINIAVCILDESGNMKAFQRMDAAPLISIDTARKKAFTAIGFQIPTGNSWYSFMKSDPILMEGSQHLKDFILLGGGSPITINNQIVGAIGISGANYKQDEVCVQAALEIIG